MNDALSVKRALLNTLYEVYVELLRDFKLSCVQSCATCCTHNVTSFTVEVDSILDFIERTGVHDLVDRLAACKDTRRLVPIPTVNRLAACCLNREEPPPISEEFDMLPCPIRTEDGCPIYPVRPLACRSMWSEVLCSETGEAVQDPLVLTINGMFEQMIEHLDAGGLCGNLVDLVVLLSEESNRADYRSGKALVPAADTGPTLPNPGFLIPQEHEEQARKIMQALAAREVLGMPFFQVLAGIRQKRADP